MLKTVYAATLAVVNVPKNGAALPKLNTASKIQNNTRTILPAV